MKKIYSLLLAILSLGSLSAQTFNVKLSNPSAVAPNSVNIDTLKILAVMVSFAEDRDGTTYGNGKFGSNYSEDYGTSILDPLPHDDEYFDSHLQFVKNYFEKVSSGNLQIKYTILADTFSVSKTMRDYSPAINSDDFTSLADFSKEVWTKADQMYPGFDFSNYDVFLIFHAGVGRDISLPGSIGNERDLPSVYLSPETFKNVYGESYNGIPVSGGAFKITNSMIIPETESRELETITGKYLFQVTINGLMCASIGSYLGLPDLFDTETGLSAIGRFGLMDGQGIFAYNGAIPPEPTPWTKIRLGWAEPVTIKLDNQDVNIFTRLSASVGDTVILKVPINSTEYYLIENRNRDANNDGSIVTLNVDGNTITKTFDTDVDGYRSYDVDSLEGVITDVDEFDWALPGSGIVIWHIDENIISEKISENKINTDKYHRGIDVEEADGIQDIGEKFYTVLGDLVIGEGDQEDFWYSTNPADLYNNEFSKNTRPNTNTNSGANSLITIKNFSAIANRMSFRVEYGDSVVKPLFTKNLNINGDFNTLSVLTSLLDYSAYYGLIGSDLIIADNNGLRKEISNFSNFKTSGQIETAFHYVFGGVDSILNTIMANSDTVWFGSKNIGQIITAPMVIVSTKSPKELLIGTDGGRVLVYDVDANPFLRRTIDLNSTVSVTKIATDGDLISVIGKRSTDGGINNSWFYIDTLGSYEFNDEVPIDLALTKDKSGNNIAVVLTDKNKFYVINHSDLVAEFSVNSSTDINSFALADLKHDGTNYIILNNGNNVEVYNTTGALADNFPFVDPEGIGFVGTPVAADFEGDSKSEIISVTLDGRIFAIDGGTGKVVSGFPISCGSEISVTPVLYNFGNKTNLAVLNDQNVLSAWSISSVEGKLYWSEENGNPQNTSFIDAAKKDNVINEFFPTTKAYNYPNPVYGGETNIRYYVSEDSKINIKIFDLAGDFVAELNDNAQGGLDNETVWNVSGIQSGVYLARIEATGTGGKTEITIVKIAVVK